MINELLTHQAYVKECPEDADEDIKLYTTHYSLSLNMLMNTDAPEEPHKDEKVITIVAQRVIANKRYTMSSRIINSIPILLTRMNKLSAFTNANFITFSDTSKEVVHTHNTTLDANDDTDDEYDRDYLSLIGSL